MFCVVLSILQAARVSVRSRAALQLEILALRHQLQVLQRSRNARVHLTQADRLLWVWLSRIWTEWRSAIVVVQPATVIACTGVHFGGFGHGKVATASVGRRCHRRSAR